MKLKKKNSRGKKLKDYFVYKKLIDMMKSEITRVNSG
jgi:hypothetical protein